EAVLVPAEREPQRLERDDRVLGRPQEPELGAIDGQGGERALADDHRVDELDRDVMRVRPGLRRAADGKQASAAYEDVGESPADGRDPVGLGGEERRAGLDAPL